MPKWAVTWQIEQEVEPPDRADSAPKPSQRATVSGAGVSISKEWLLPWRKVVGVPPCPMDFHTTFDSKPPGSPSPLVLSYFVNDTDLPEGYSISDVKTAVVVLWLRDTGFLSFTDSNDLVYTQVPTTASFNTGAMFMFTTELPGTAITGDLEIAVLDSGDVFGVWVPIAGASSVPAQYAVGVDTIILNPLVNESSLVLAANAGDDLVTSGLFTFNLPGNNFDAGPYPTGPLWDESFIGQILTGPVPNITGKIGTNKLPESLGGGNLASEDESRSVIWTPSANFVSIASMASMAIELPSVMGA